ncbi:short chain dehydrogenase/ reductase [Diplogelasinospora grovesii]|uniref:Short chain dehydrogenase/ reductase n=1 Tax=Diplogelasinospora grovesii TaxID=303347 RepID=A0AAN6MVJ3_9PEZI|nr:short chain dehydrogenase/ reductase [Diplogelasinospora grovesii]
MPFFDFIHDQREKLPLATSLVPSTVNIKDGTYIVTGANTGLGLECARHLVSLGAGRVILAVRSVSKGEAALADIRKTTARRTAGEVWELDLSSFASVDAFIARLNTLDRIDGLINNASVAMPNHTFAQGADVETSIFVNVVTTMLLTVRAVPKLQESAQKFNMTPHLVIVSSNAGIGNDMKGRVERCQGDVFAAVSKPEGFTAFSQYPTTKLLQIYAVRELASLLPVKQTGVVINHVNPGLCYTELDRNAGILGKLYMAIFRKLLARTAEEGSRTLLQAVWAGQESHGTYCSECRIRDEKIPEWIADENGHKTQRRVWEDLVKRLDKLDHGIDVAELLGSKTAEAK